MSGLDVVGADAQGRYLKLGDIVRLSSDIAHLYDDTGDRWIIDGTDVGFNAPGILREAPTSAVMRIKPNSTLKIRNVTTGIWVHAPSAWVLPYGEAPPEAAKKADDLRELAHAILDSVAIGWAPKIEAWARAYVERTQRPREAATEPMAAQEYGPSMSAVISSLLRLGELQSAGNYSAADIVAAIERLPKRQHDCGVPPAIRNMLKKHGFSADGNADYVAFVIDDQFGKTQLLQSRLDEIAKALGNT